MLPPGTGNTVLLVDGLLVGVGVADGDADVVPAAVGELVAVPEGEPDGDADGEPEAVGVGDAAMAPPTALPF
jgi:hypothetical protein